MFRGLYTAYTGMRVQQDRLDLISNNLANVNTTGYKKDGLIVASFDKVLASKINDPEVNHNQAIGYMSLGARVERTYTNFEQGSAKATGNPLNVAIEGTGMIAIGKYDSEGNLTKHYTRDGAFSMNPEGQLVTKDGYFVLGENGPITMDTQTIIDDNGSVISEGQEMDQIQLVDFTDTNLLRKLGSGVFANKEEGNITEFTGIIRQGFVESSNVNSIDEMVNMINVMRTFESSQKVMTTYDQTMEKAATEIGRA